MVQQCRHDWESDISTANLFSVLNVNIWWEDSVVVLKKHKLGRLCSVEDQSLDVALGFNDPNSCRVCTSGHR